MQSADSGDLAVHSKVADLVHKWRQQSLDLDYKRYLLEGLRYYSSLSEEEKKEWNRLRDEACTLVSCANQLAKALNE